MRKFIFLFIVFLFYSQGSYAQIKPGIYKQVRYKIGDKPVENYPFELYKVSDGETIWQIDIMNVYSLFTISGEQTCGKKFTKHLFVVKKM